MKPVKSSSRPPLRNEGRIVALDIIRGYFILVIASVHLGYWPSILSIFDGRGQLWISEADGFFLISGLLVGIIRQRDIQRSGLGQARSKLWHRAWKLYYVGLILSFVYLVLGRFLLSSGVTLEHLKGGLDTVSSWPSIIGKILTLRYVYGWADFLPYYAIFMAIAPGLLYFLMKKRWYVVVGLSLIGWVAQWLFGGGSNPVWQFLIWQAPFFVGMTIGYYWTDLHAYYDRMAANRRQQLKFGLVVSAVLIFALSFLTVIVPWVYRSDWLPWQHLADWLGAIGHTTWYDRLLMNQRRGLLRLPILLLGVGGLYVIVRRFEAVIQRTIGRLLTPFGMNSLYVYILESAFIFAIPLFFQQASFWLNSGLEIFIVGSIWIAVQRKFLFSIIPR